MPVLLIHLYGKSLRSVGTVYRQYTNLIYHFFFVYNTPLPELKYFFYIILMKAFSTPCILQQRAVLAGKNDKSGYAAGTFISCKSFSRFDSDFCRLCSILCLPVRLNIN